MKKFLLWFKYTVLNCGLTKTLEAIILSSVCIHCFTKKFGVYNKEHIKMIYNSFIDRVYGNPELMDVNIITKVNWLIETFDD